ncbi:hypothetical protein, partial [Paenibacillus tarimensis]|uniref:hypothetical protein n=1 Tax=Paenibacillus tarimensis TaxID=416012 RepID=UPI0039F00E29
MESPSKGGRYRFSRNIRPAPFWFTLPNFKGKRNLSLLEWKYHQPSKEREVSYVYPIYHGPASLANGPAR